MEGWREDRVVQLQVATASGVERVDRIVIGLRQVHEKLVEIRVGTRADFGAARAKVQHARRRDGHLGHATGGLREETEVVQHRMPIEGNASGDAHVVGAGLDAFELDGALHLVDARQAPIEIEMPL